jgi:chromosome segregation protein
VVAEGRVGEARELLDGVRFSVQELKVPSRDAARAVCRNARRSRADDGWADGESTVADWEVRLGETGEKIERLGQVNLAAIDEFREQSERKEYLDRQHADLTDALTTLEDAIRRIDRETKSRFQETFDRVNAGLKESSRGSSVAGTPTSSLPARTYSMRVWRSWRVRPASGTARSASLSGGRRR